MTMESLQRVSAAETLKTSHRPDGKVADELSSTLACTIAADASVNTTVNNSSMYVPQILENFPSPPWDALLL